MAWVILGHTFFHSKSGYITNIYDVGDFIKDFKYSYILSSPFSVDVFFFLGGFLAIYLIVKGAKASNGKINFLKIYIHRIIRMFPLFFVTLLIFCYVMPLMEEVQDFSITLIRLI
jgi:peptidoglycan/LPS O-acetylase OafA/YrhL